MKTELEAMHALANLCDGWQISTCRFRAAGRAIYDARLAAFAALWAPAGLPIDNHQPSAYISAPRVRRTHLAQVAELVDALVSGTSGAIRGGSSPLLGTIQHARPLSAQLLAACPPYPGRGQECLVGDPHQIAPFVLRNIESGIRTCDEFVERTDLHVARRQTGAHADT
jgi:hypothetical protein